MESSPPYFFDKNGESHDELVKFRRFLTYGSEKSRTEPLKSTKKVKDFALEIVPSLSLLLESDRGEEALEEIQSVLERNHSHLSALFCLAACARTAQDTKIKQAAYKTISCEYFGSTQLFQFVVYAEKLSGETTGWGRCQKRAVSDWYLEKDALRLAAEVTKCASHVTWNHKDLLRLAHVKAANQATDHVLTYIRKGFRGVELACAGKDITGEVLAVYDYLSAVHSARTDTDEHVVARLVEIHRLTLEQVGTQVVNSGEVWSSLIPHTPLRRLLPRLGRLTATGLLGSEGKNDVLNLMCKQLSSEKAVKSSRINPVELLLAQKCYNSGQSAPGKDDKRRNTWTSNPLISDALYLAFHHSFMNVSCGDRRVLVAVDVSSSTESECRVLSAPQLSPLTGAALLAMLMVRSQQSAQLVVFSDTIAEARLSKQMPLHEVSTAIEAAARKTESKSCDVSLPLLWAAENNKVVDLFVIVTDCKSSHGPVSCVEALAKYKKDMDLSSTSLAVCLLSGGAVRVADKAPGGVLDVLGLDVTTTTTLAAFASRQL